MTTFANKKPFYDYILQVTSLALVYTVTWGKQTFFKVASSVLLGELLFRQAGIWLDFVVPVSWSHSRISALGEEKTKSRQRVIDNYFSKNLILIPIPIT